MRRISCRLGASVLALVVLTSSLTAQQRNRVAPVVLKDPLLVGRSERIGNITSAAVGRDGTVVVADDLNSRIIVFTPEGRVKWTAGRKGGGPGEFRHLYRVGVRPDGAVYAFDSYDDAVTIFSPAGEYVTRQRLPVGFTQTDAIAVHDDGTMVVSGTSPTTVRAIGHDLSPGSRSVA